MKPNVGHSEGASGLTSVIKAVLALEKRIIPPNIHFKNPNPDSKFQGKAEGFTSTDVNVQSPSVMGSLKYPLSLSPGRRDEKRESVLIALELAVPMPMYVLHPFSLPFSHYGGKRLAHTKKAILDSARSYCEPFGRTLCLDKHDADAHLLLVSAASPTAVGQRVKDLKQYIDIHSPDIQDVAYTLANKLTHLQCRSFLLVNRGKPIQLPEDAPVKATPRELIFIFTGQGAQWPGMAKELMTWNEGFRADIRKMDETLRGLQDPPDWSIEGKPFLTETYMDHINVNSQTRLRLLPVPAGYQMRNCLSHSALLSR